MTTQTTTITVAGIELTAVKTDEGYGVSVVEYQEYLALDKSFTTELKAGKKPELARSAGFENCVRLINVRIGKTTKAFIDTQDLVKLVGVLATRGNQTALVWLVALATETLERRIDNSLGLSKSEETYEKETAATFKSLREQWLESRDDARGNHMAFQNACLVNRIPAPLAHDRITKAITGRTAEEHRQLPIVAGTEDVGLNHVPEVSHEDLVKIAMVKDQFSRQKRGKTETWEAMVDRAIAKVI